MRKLIKNTLSKIVQNSFGWKIIRPFALFGIHANNSRLEYELKNKKNEGPFFIESNAVLNGPFQGLLYPVKEAVGSTLYPKLLGCYELELWPIIEWISQKSYDKIIDVGCAEGYYANGLAAKFTTIPVFAYDIDLKAQKLCKTIATENGLTNLTVFGELNHDELSTQCLDTKTLIVSDCEGYEADLICNTSIEALRYSTLLIETHDFYDIQTSKRIKSHLSDSHEIISVFSIDDFDKVRSYSINQLEGLNFETRYQLVREGRPCTMEWLFCIPKKEIQNAELDQLITELNTYYKKLYRPVELHLNNRFEL